MTPTTAAARPRYSENMHFLTDRRMREVIVGLSIRTADTAGAGVRPKEGEEIRNLLTAAIDELEATQSARWFRETRALGAKALAERDTAAAAPKSSAAA